MLRPTIAPLAALPLILGAGALLNSTPAISETLPTPQVLAQNSGTTPPSDRPNNSQGMGRRGMGPGAMGDSMHHRPEPINFAGAAAQLGVTEQALKDALGVPLMPMSPDEDMPGDRDRGQGAGQRAGQGQGRNQGMGQGIGQGMGQGMGMGHHRPDFAAAATQLGVTEDALKDALWDNRTFPHIAAAAEELGIPMERLKQALGIPTERPSTFEERPPRPDLAAAAAQLGISEERLKEALGVPPHMGDRGMGRRGQGGDRESNPQGN